MWSFISITLIFFIWLIISKITGHSVSTRSWNFSLFSTVWIYSSITLILGLMWKTSHSRILVFWDVITSFIIDGILHLILSRARVLIYVLVFIKSLRVSWIEITSFWRWIFTQDIFSFLIDRRIGRIMTRTWNIIWFLR